MERLINENVISGKWNQLKGEIQKTWGKLTGDEIDHAKGDLRKFYGTVQEKYGHSQEEVHNKLDGLLYPNDSAKKSGQEL